jgi:3-methyladenine DNA glycosylase/8-oxoguanine DNA glycosylase
MVQRIVETIGDPVPGDSSLRTFPTADQIAIVPFEEFSANAKLGYRNAAVHALATDVAGGRIDLEAWQTDPVDSETLRKRLLSLRGIGPYAAACLMLYMGRSERVNVDSWARMMVGKELGRVVTDKEVHEFFEPYAPFGGLVYHFYSWNHEEPVY